jgi:hypothetical protein
MDYHIVSQPPEPPSALATMRGENPEGSCISANSSFLEFDGKPWLPLMGEFHFSRYRASLWEDELLKMKAGGIDIVSSYVFWIHHEEEEGVFDWTGQRNLRAFVQLCAKHGLYVFARIGPWTHGEVRNGGHPDWILRKGIKVRSTHPVYLKHVSRHYAQIAKQLTGLYWKDGGPIVGVQIENELVSHGPGVGAEYLLRLKQLAMDSGIVAPLYTMTGWGNPEVPRGELLPVFGGYPDSFWDPADKAEQSVNYSFSDMRDDGAIGTDMGLAKGRENERYWAPYLTCETGPGMQVAYHRRPFIAADDVAAIAIAKLGSGSNLPGYFVFHGSVHPEGKLTHLNEACHSGGYNDCPVYSYDFQAPLGEFGQVRDSYHAYLPLHAFIHHFGSDLAPMRPTIGQEHLNAPLDNSRLKWALRSDGQAGFIFVNNYVRNVATPCFNDTQFHIELDAETVTVPRRAIDIPVGAYFIWPVNMTLGALLLKYATVQPLCKLAASNTWVFFAIEGIGAELAFDAAMVDTIDVASGSTTRQDDLLVVSGLLPGTDCLVTVMDKQGKERKLLVLTTGQARNCFCHKDGLHISDGGALAFDGDEIILETCSVRNTILTYPAVRGGQEESGDDALFSRRVIAFHTPVPPFSWRLLQEADTDPVELCFGHDGRLVVPDDAQYDRGALVELSIAPDSLDGVHDLFVRIDYVGDSGRLFIGDRFVHDHFYNGRPWEISLRYFAPEILVAPVTLKLLPLRADARVYLDKPYRPDFADQAQRLDIRSISAVPVYRSNVDDARDQESQREQEV